MVIETYPVYEEIDNELVHVGDGQILHAKSHCAFSGLNDEYLAEQPEEGPASDGFGRTQSYGQLVKALGPLGAGGASFGCNPNNSFEE